MGFKNEPIKINSRDYFGISRSNYYSRLAKNLRLIV